MVLSVGMSRGRLAGLVFGLGCALGCLSHTVLAALGVGALIAASPTAFTALRWAGGAYLLWLGVQAWRHAGGGAAPGAATPPGGLGRLFAKGLLANAINPKVVLFFLSLLPQFVHPEQGPVAPQMAVLGTVFTLQAALLFDLLGAASGGIGQWLQRRPRAGVWLDRLAATVFVGLGLRLLVAR
jgi:threonine/homoserine/homoserine lactone efflux protein